ncbi:MAG TPA: primosomal protein N' [Polyangiaceae bacterium]
MPVPLGQAFTYSVPEATKVAPVRGARVLVEFGKRKLFGVVLDVSPTAGDEVEPAKLKPVLAVIDTEPVVKSELLDFLLELARYYLAPIGEVLRLALPALERGSLEDLAEQGLLAPKARAVGRVVQVAVASAGASAPETLAGAALAVWQHLSEKEAVPIGDLEKLHKGARRTIKKLAELGLCHIERREQVSANATAEFSPDQRPELTEAQARAVAALTEALDQRTPRAFLLDGVTASGKTEVYLHAAEHCLKQGKGAIVLVPEIALTPQLTARFRARLGDAIAIVHSGLGNKERLHMWKQLQKGAFKVAVGARSALFAPVTDLALICVDEEHDGSFKQEEGVRYNARDMALLRAHRAEAVAVLGSATPSLSSEAAVRSGKMTRLRLPARANQKAVLPRVTVVDLKRVGAGPSGDRFLSLPLYRALERCLGAGEQAILFLNRRGFAPSLVCEGCGNFIECPQCSVAMTLHRARGERLVCHYCDYARARTETCPRCGSDRLTEEGVGTERVEEQLGKAFPKARIGRLDRDVAAGAKSERVLARMRRGEIDILVGTQMVTKGHDLPSVTLVGVLNADAALSLPDFRAAERCFHLLVQVAGRAGRGDKPGEVLIQTRQPEHPAVALAAQHDVPGFTEREMRERRELGYPPFARLALIKLDALDAAVAEREATRLAALARSLATPVISVVGPAPAPLARLRNRYRFRFMVRGSDRAALRKVLLGLARAKPRGDVRVAIDVDPVSML